MLLNKTSNHIYSVITNFYIKEKEKMKMSYNDKMRLKTLNTDEQ